MKRASARLKKLVGLGLALSALCCVEPGALRASPAPSYDFPARSARVVSYDMKVSLDPEIHQVAGTQTIIWRNDSDSPVRSLWFHLYLNAFTNDHSTMAREGGMRQEHEWMEDERSYWGSCRLLSLKTAAGEDLIDTLEYRHPDDDNEDDRTVARVLLSRPVAPGASITLYTEFESVLPQARRRSGHTGDHYHAAQWFPKLGVYEGLEKWPQSEGWNCHQYHDHTEFFADHGRYRVEITVPSEYGGPEGGKVGATGQRVSETESEGSWTYLYIQDDVHDFAWTADPDYLVEERLYDHAERRTPAVIEEEKFLREEVGVPAEQLDLPPVRVRLLLQPDHAHLADRHFEAVFHAITWYGLWYGPYPYKTLTVVDPQRGGATGGMEYPTLITAGTRWLSSEASLSPESVTVHEFGHQYFYGLLANDEAAEAWLDEGFNSYSDDKVLERAYGGRTRTTRIAQLRLPYTSLLGLPSSEDAFRLRGFLGLRTFGRRPGSVADLLLQQPGLSWARDARIHDPLDSLSSHVAHATKDSIDTLSFTTYDSGSYRNIAYTKPALMLTQLERVIGRANFLRALRAYNSRFRHAHPTGEDFFDVLEEVTGYSKADGLALLEPEVLDYAVGTVTSKELAPLRGLDPRHDVFPLLTGKEENATKRRKTTIRVRRLGTLAVPVEVAVRFAGIDEPEIFSWDGVAPWHEFEFVRNEKVIAVTVDPEYRLVLDANRLNNYWQKEKSSLPAMSWAARVFVMMQSAFLGARTLS